MTDNDRKLDKTLQELQEKVSIHHYHSKLTKMVALGKVGVE